MSTDGKVDKIIEVINNNNNVIFEYHEYDHKSQLGKLLLKQMMIEAGINKSDIQISGNNIIVNNNKYE